MPLRCFSLRITHYAVTPLRCLLTPIVNNVCTLLYQQILVSEVYGQFVLVCLLKVLYFVRFLPHCKHMARRQPEISWNSSCGLLWLLLALNLISHLQNLYKLRTTFKIKLHAKSSKIDTSFMVVYFYFTAAYCFSISFLKLQNVLF